MKDLTQLKPDMMNVFAQTKDKTVLLYNIKKDRRGLLLRKFLDANDMKIVEVKKENYFDPIGYVLGRPGFERFEGLRAGALFTDEMLVMHSLSAGQFHGLLDTLRSTGQTVRLKAVVTEHNSSWSAVRLHRELLAEAAAMEKQTSLKRQSRYLLTPC